MERVRFRRRYGLSAKLRHVPMAPAAACHAASADVSDTPPVAPPLPAEAPELARLLSSFFRTSCLVLWDETGARLHHSARLLVCLAAPPPTPPPHTRTHTERAVCVPGSRAAESPTSCLPLLSRKGGGGGRGRGARESTLALGAGWHHRQAAWCTFLVLLGAGTSSSSSRLPSKVQFMSRPMQSWESYRQEQIPPVSSCGWLTST